MGKGPKLDSWQKKKSFVEDISSKSDFVHNTIFENEAKVHGSDL